MRHIASEENVSPEDIRVGIENGSIVILRNKRHDIANYCAVGEDLRTKVNANIGTSKGKARLDYQLRRLKAVVEAGTDTVMDLSISGRIDNNRRRIISEIDIPIGTVPIYQAQIETAKRYGAGVKMTIDDVFDVIERHAKDGVDYMTLHCGITPEGIEKASKRKMPFVSRGGSIIAGWMLHNNKENPLSTHYEGILELARKYDFTISLGDGLRPGCIADATDEAQICELETIGKLARQAHEASVQVMIEGPGHIPLDQIQKNVELKKRYCGDFPFYVLGPLPTDIAPGYDHFVAGIGGALIGMYGAAYLCSVTPAEHLGLPTPEDDRTGIFTTRIAAHIADVAKGIKGARDLDDLMSEARQVRDWNGTKELAMDPKQYAKHQLEQGKPCSMCGELCALKLVDTYFRPDNKSP